MMANRPRIIGLTWRKLKNHKNENEENEEDDIPSRQQEKNNKKLQISDSKIGMNAPQKLTRFSRRLSQAVTVTSLGMRETIGSFRQKIRCSTRRRKRLFEVQSPYSTANINIQTPSSAQRRSVRIAERQEVQLYSPFQIDTPGSTKRATPGRIRMGVHEPKRFNFSSPGQLQRDLNSVEESLKQLNKLSEDICGTQTARSAIRTTPGGRKTASRRKAIFV